MIDDRLQLLEADLLALPADAFVVEDNAQLAAAHGYSAALDKRYPELPALREQALLAYGALPLGSAVALQAGDGTIVLAVVSFSDAQGGQAARATPLDIAAAARDAVLRAAELGARHVALPALGTRYGHHVLPAVPKKLPRYVMASAQLIGIRDALAASAIERVSLCLTQRDRAIFTAVLGRGEAQTDDEYA